MAKRKHASDWMLTRARKYLSGKGSYRQIARANGISERSLLGWVRKYEKPGEASFNDLKQERQWKFVRQLWTQIS